MSVLTVKHQIDIESLGSPSPISMGVLLTSLHVMPRTVTGVYADCETSNRYRESGFSFTYLYGCVTYKSTCDAKDSDMCLC